MAAAAILAFQFMWIWPFRRVDSAVFMFYTKFGSNTCYSHWDRRTYDSDLHLMTFGQWSSPRRRGPSSHIIWCKISLSSPKLLTFFRNSSLIFSLCEFGHSCVLVVCSVPNLVQIYVTVTEIDAFIFSSFNFWSRGHLCMASMHLPMKFGAIRSYWYLSKIKDGGRRHLGFVWVSHETTHEASFMVRRPTSCKMSWSAK